MSAQLAAFEEDRKQYQEQVSHFEEPFFKGECIYEQALTRCPPQLDIVYASLKDDPGNAELLALKAELDEMVQMIDESIAELKPKQPAAAAPKAAAAPTKKAPSPPPQQPPAQEKWSRENHPAFKKAAQEEREREQQQREAEASAAPASYQVNDTVLAKWVSGDKGFYPARITSVTGSSTAPIYTVRFKSYDTVETLRGKDIRPVSNKRKADGTSAGGSSSAGSTAAGGSGSGGSYGGGSASNAGSSQATPVVQSPSGGGGTPTSGIVLQAQPSVYPHAEQAKAAAGKEDAPVKKFKKIKANKELEAGKNKWQEFSTKGKFGKTAKKDSMFRTPEGAHGRGTS